MPTQRHHPRRRKKQQQQPRRGGGGGRSKPAVGGGLGRGGRWELAAWEEPRDLAGWELSLVTDTLGVARVAALAREYCADVVYGYPHRNTIMLVCLRLIRLLGPAECTTLHIERSLLTRHLTGQDWPTDVEAQHFRAGQPLSPLPATVRAAQQAVEAFDRKQQEEQERQQMILRLQHEAAAAGEAKHRC